MISKILITAVITLLVSAAAYSAGLQRAVRRYRSEGRTEAEVRRRVRRAGWVFVAVWALLGGLAALWLAGYPLIAVLAVIVAGFGAMVALPLVTGLRAARVAASEARDSR